MITKEVYYALDYQDYNTAGFNVSGYAYGQPHAPRTIIDQPVAPGTTLASDDPRIKTKKYEYDFNGNQTKITQTVCAAPEPELLRENLWDEENRLRAIDLNPSSPSGGGGGLHPISIYTYDAGGERIVKQNSATVAIYENAKNVGSSIKSDFMLYPSGMLVFRPSSGGDGGGSYTKHYFVGSQRVSSKIGTTTNLGKFLDEWTLQENSDGGAAINLVATSHTQLTKAETGVTKVYTAFGIAPSPTFNSNTTFQPIPAFTTPPLGDGGLEEQYYFHPDHLGSSNYITNLAGDVSQHMEYFAFGETFVEEHKNSINSPFKFNGKELDEESGLYYYGARYYDPKLSIWASVDPLAEKFPNQSPYDYCFNNPLNLIDPDGRGPTDWYRNNTTGKIKWIEGSGNVSGYTNKGFNYSDQSYGKNKNDHLIMDGSTKLITVNGNTIADFNKASAISGDGIKVWGVGGDAIAGNGIVQGSDRGSGSIDPVVTMGGGVVEDLWNLGQAIGTIINWVTGNDGKNATAGTPQASKIGPSLNGQNGTKGGEMVDTEVETSRTNGASATNISIVQSFKKDTTVVKGTNVKEIGNRNKIKAQAKANRENIRIHGKTY